MSMTHERIRNGGCSICRDLPTYNRRTLRGLEESDREVASDLASRKAGGPGTMKAYSDLDELLKDLHAL